MDGDERGHCSAVTSKIMIYVLFLSIVINFGPCNIRLCGIKGDEQESVRQYSYVLEICCSTGAVSAGL